MFIYTQLVGFIITLYVFIVWKLNKKLDSFTDVIFVFTSIVALIGQVLDILCQFVMSGTISFLNLLEQSIIIDAYLISIPTYLFAIALYINKTLFSQKKFRTIEIILIVVLIANSVVTCILPFTIVYNESCSLPVGSAVTYTYISTFVFAMALLIEFLVHKKDIKKWTFTTTIIWLSTFIFGGIIQFILIDLIFVPIISLVISIGVLVLYLIVENPGNRFDYISNSFHFESFVGYINEVIDGNIIQSILYVTLVEKNANNPYYIRSVFDELIRKYDNHFGLKFFSGYSNELIIASRDFGDLQEVASSISKCIDAIEEKSKHKASFSSMIVLIPDMSYVSSYKILRSVFDEYNIKGKVVLEDYQIITVNKEICKKHEDNLLLALDVDNAIKEKNIVIDYQPLHDNENSGVINAEAIAKVVTSSGKTLLPKDYYSAAERYDRFMLIDEMTFSSVCEDISHIEKFANKLGMIFCRVSVQALEKISICESFFDVLERNSISPTRICLEITNANAILQKDMLLSNITAMQKRGINFAIGGFGSGESNLNYFIDLPMHFIKFDQSVLSNALKDPKAAMIMKDITELAHALDFKVVAVGVEDEESKKFANDCGVEMLLGNYISAPLNTEEFYNYVVTERRE